MGRALLAGASLCAVVMASGIGAVHAGATPTCPTGSRVPCSGRIIPEADQAAGFLTYAEWTGAMTQLQTEHPDRVKFIDLGQSAGGRPVYDVIVTDFSDQSPLSSRTGFFFNGDIHGDERDGTEGFARVVEDLAETSDATLSADLHHEVLVFTDANPDGWQCGDVPDGATQSAASCQQAQACYQSGQNGCPAGTNTPPVVEYTRVNANSHDLNREWPVVGFQNPTTFPLTDPEVQSLVEENGNILHRQMGINFAYGYDVHGSATVETPPSAQLMLDVLLSAGQFDLKRSMLQTQLFSQYMTNLSATSSDNVLATVGGATGQQVYKVGEWDTSWDIYGYLVSGGFADWQANQWTGLGAVTGTIELWINGEPGQQDTFSGYNQQVEASNVHSMRVAVRTAMDIALQSQQASLALPGPVAYVTNTHSLGSGDGSGDTTPVGSAATRPPSKPYAASTNQFFTDLAPYADHPITAVDASTITAASQLSGFADVVVAQDPHLSNATFLAALEAYARAGGTVVLTDAALQDLAPLGLLAPSAVTSSLQYAGFINQLAGDPLTAGMRPLGSQTYEPVPLGYAVDNTFSSTQSTVHSPTWAVTQAVWEAAGGRTAGTTGTGKTSLGEIPLGTGHVRIVGSLLPDPSGDAAHPFGVSDYAVTYVGYRIFENVLSGTAQLTPPIVEGASLTTGPDPSTLVPPINAPESPAGTALLLIAGPLSVTALAMRRRTRTPTFRDDPL